jgi:hypothetical protein
MPTYARPNITAAGKGRPTSALFQKRLEEAVLSVPENVRAGFAPADRPMARPKIAAGWLHCLRLSGADIAKMASTLTGTAVNYGSLRNWRMEEKFCALVEEAQRVLTEDYVAAYDSCGVDDWTTFERFRQESLVLHPTIAFGLLHHIERASQQAPTGSHARNQHELHRLQLLTDLGLSYGTLSKTGLRRGLVKHGATRTSVIEVFRDGYAHAEKVGDWQLARQVVDPLLEIARGAAERADRADAAAIAREEAKAARAQRQSKRRAHARQHHLRDHQPGRRGLS